MTKRIKMTKRKAKKLSLIKWEYARKYGCNFSELLFYLVTKHNDIYEMRSGCAYCEKYLCKNKTGRSDCKKCPLYKIGEGCNELNSLYFKWRYCKNKNKRKKYASQLYDAILRS